MIFWHALGDAVLEKNTLLGWQGTKTLQGNHLVLQAGSKGTQYLNTIIRGSLIPVTWTPKACKLTAFMAVMMGLGLLCYILLGSS